MSDLVPNPWTDFLMTQLIYIFETIYWMMFVAVVGPPSKPSGPLLVKEITKDSALLTWEPPKDTGGEPIGYVRAIKMFIL